MRTISILVMLTLCGCDLIGTPTIDQRAEKHSTDIEKLKKSAASIQADVLKSKRELSEKLAECDVILAKLAAVVPLPTPSPIPNPAPSPVPAPTPSPVRPDPLPPPVPAPLPTEPVDGRFGIAKAVWKIAKEVQSPDRVAESQALASVFESVAAQVAAGTLNGTLLDPQWHKISVALTAGNKPIMAKHLAAWKSSAEQLSEAIGQRYGDGKLNSNQDWSDLLNEIASGLKAVK